MIELIICISKNNGIGLNNKLPWNYPEELSIFRNKTLNKKILVGHTTAKYLPKLKNREIICLSRSNPNTDEWENNVEIINSLDDIIDEDLFIAGGLEVYNAALKKKDFVKRVHISFIKNNYTCDKFLDMTLLKDFVIIEKSEYEKFDHYVLEKTEYGERQYLDLLQNIITNGSLKNGRNGFTKSLFSNHFKFNLEEGFPLLTTKKMFLRGILEEFLFFIRGDTDTNYLSEKKVKIWEGNTTTEFIESRGLPYAKGIMGPMYGYQWRTYNKKYIIDENGMPIKDEGGIDQLNNVINLIKTEPNSRRILLTSYNPIQSEEGVLYPCHSIIIQFFVQDNYLDLFCYNRSQDTFLGVPYNISSTSLLLMLVGKLTNKTPRFVNMSMGDTHLYENHLEQAQEQISRIPYKLPILEFPEINRLEDIQNLKTSDFKLQNYKSHKSIKGIMSV